LGSSPAAAGRLGGTARAGAAGAAAAAGGGGSSSSSRRPGSVQPVGSSGGGSDAGSSQGGSSRAHRARRKSAFGEWRASLNPLLVLRCGPRLVGLPQCGIGSGTRGVVGMRLASGKGCAG
jgi:hypothetical protein